MPTFYKPLIDWLIYSSTILIYLTNTKQDSRSRAFQDGFINGICLLGDGGLLGPLGTLGSVKVMRLSTWVAISVRVSKMVEVRAGGAYGEGTRGVWLERMEVQLCRVANCSDIIRADWWHWCRRPRASTTQPSVTTRRSCSCLACKTNTVQYCKNYNCKKEKTQIYYK